MTPSAPTSTPPRPRRARWPWLVALAVAGGSLGLLGWFVLASSPGLTGKPARPTVAARLATVVPMATARPQAAPGASPPGAVAARYLAAWSAGQHAAMYDLLTPAAQARVGRAAFIERHQAVLAEAGVTRIEAALLPGTSPIAPAQPFQVTVETAPAGPVVERNSLPLVVAAGRWGIDWTPALIFADLRPGDRVRLLHDTPPRGRIFDRHGRLLAHQAEVATVGVVPDELTDAPATVAALAAALALPAERIRAALADARPDWFVPLARRPWQHPAPSLADLAALPGVDIRVASERAYPLGPVAAHVLGYVGPLRPDEIEVGPLRARGYRAGDWVGRDGIEAAAERQLAGERGGRLTIVAADGTTWRVLAERRAVPARDVYLTLDLALQERAEAALGERVGALVGLDATSGAVRALVSRPAFDPNRYVLGAPTAVAPDPLPPPPPNRASAAAYPLGGLFTPITMVAALDGLRLPAETPLECPATFRLPGRPEVWRTTPPADPRLTPAQAVRQGCPTLFHALGQRLDARDPRLLPIMARRFGLGQSTGLAGVSETAGVAPDPAWKAATLRETWSAADAVALATGGGLLATPLQVARAYAAIATGDLPTPHLIERLQPSGEMVESPPITPGRGRLDVAPGALATVRAALAEALPPADGPALAGLAASVVPELGGTPYAWAAAYTPTSDASLALAVLVERGGDGPGVAAPLLRRVAERATRPGPVADKELGGPRT